MKIKINIRLAVLVILLAVFVIVVGYKYYEWSTLQYLNYLYNQTWSQELNLVQQENKNELVFLKLYKKVFAKDAPKYSLSNSYNELEGDFQIVINSQENYLSTLQQNQNTYSNINTFFLFGERGDFARKVIDNQIKYYNLEIEDSKTVDASNWLEYNLLTTWRDMETVNKFYLELGSDAITNTPKYFSDLSPIQKYTNNDFQFNHSSLIAQYYPDGNSVLDKYKDYFASYYTTAQNYDTGDTQSAAYSFTTLQDNAANLGYNISDIFDQQKEHMNKNANTITQIVANQSNDIKNFQAKRLGRYPILSPIGNWGVDLVLCQLYDFRASLVHNITTKYITAKTPSELFNELSSVPPSTQFIDSKFDKSSMKIDNNDQQITVTCIDKIDNSSYVFVTVK